MLKQVQHVAMIEARGSPLCAEVGLEPFQESQQGSHLTGGKWITHGYVDAFDRCGQCAQHRKEQRFVGKDNGRLLGNPHPAFRLKVLEDLHRLPRLSDGRWDTDDFNGRHPLRVNPSKGCSRRKTCDILTDEGSRLVGRILQQFALEVPEKVGLPLFLQFGKQGDFAIVQGVESDEDDFVEIGKEPGIRTDGVGHAPVDHARIAQAVGQQAFPEALVEAKQTVPEDFKTLPGVALGHPLPIETPAEGSDGLALFFR